MFRKLRIYRNLKKILCYIVLFVLCGTFYINENIFADIENSNYNSSIDVMKSSPDEESFEDSEIPLESSNINDSNDFEDITDSFVNDSVDETSDIPPDIQDENDVPETTEDNTENITEETDEYIKKPVSREVLISAVGDLTLGSNYTKPYENSFYNFYDLYGANYFLENVASILNSDDCTIANLECALTDNTDDDIRKNQSYCYKGYTKYTDILTAGSIDVVNLANNHSRDYTTPGYNDTINALDSAGIAHCGNDETVAIREVNGIKIGFIGSVGYYRWEEIKTSLDYLDKMGVDIKVVSFHWGNMDETIANKYQQTAAHYVIDNGADLVIGHHPHVLQGIENYKGKYIVYSLGNFIFDGNVISDIENRTSIIFQQKFVFEDDKIVESSINIIPIITTTNMSRNNFKPGIADDIQKEEILKKIADRSIY